MKIICSILFLSFLVQVRGQDSNRFSSIEDSVKTNVRQGNTSRSIHFLRVLDSISIASNNDSLRMRVLDNYAFSHFFSGNYERSVEFIAQALNIAEKGKYWDAYFDMKNNLGMIHSKLENYSKSQAAYEEVLIKTQELGIDINTDYLSTLINLGSSLQSQGVFSKADSIFDVGLSLAREFEDRELIAATLKFKAKNSLERKDYTKVLVIVDTIEQYYFERIASRLKDDPIFHRAKAHFYLKNYKAAEKDIQQAIQLMADHKNDPSLVEKIVFYSKLLEVQGKNTEALKQLKIASQLKDSFDVVQMNAKVLEIEEKYEAEKKEKENLELKQEASIKDLTIAKKNNFILFGSLIFLGIIGLLIIIQLRRLRKKNADLKLAMTKRELAEKELEIVRDNIAKDFHDEMGNRMARITALSDLMIQFSSSKKKKDMIAALDRIKADSNELYKGTRDFMFSLKSESDNLEEVVTYLSDFGEEYLQSFGIDFFTENYYPKRLKLPYYWNRQIILIFKEAITNSAKHSNANAATLVTLVEDNLLIISLTDNGKGFEDSYLERKNGIENMNSRAKKINALLEIDSSKDGTLVSLKAHLPK